MSIKEGLQITQAALQEVYELEREIAEKETHLGELKEGVKSLLIAKAPIEFGRFTAHLVTIPGRNVPWKQVVIEELGVDFMESCRRRYPVRVRYDVKVEEHAIPPLWRSGANSKPDGTEAG